MLVLCIYQFQECYVNFDIFMTTKTMQYLKRVNFDVVIVSLFQLFLSVSKKNCTFDSIRQNLILRQSFGVIGQRVDRDWLTAK